MSPATGDRRVASGRAEGGWERASCQKKGSRNDPFLAIPLADWCVSLDSFWRPGSRFRWLRPLGACRSRGVQPPPAQLQSADPDQGECQTAAGGRPYWWPGPPRRVTWFIQTNISTVQGSGLLRYQRVTVKTHRAGLGEVSRSRDQAEVGGCCMACSAAFLHGLKFLQQL